MLASITPLGERGRNRRWGATVTAYVAGSLMAGAAVGAGLGLAGDLAPGMPPTASDVLLVLAGGVLLLGAAADLHLAWLPLPTVRRQVNEDWLLRYRGGVCGLGFGLQLGLGVVTIVTTAAIYGTLFLALLSGSWAAGLAVGATFGLTRALPILMMRRATTPERLRAAHLRMQAWAPSAHRAAVGAQVAGAGGCLLATVAL